MFFFFCLFLTVFFFHPFLFFCSPRDAYVAVMRLVESVDDTVTCQKTILAELLKPLEVT